MNTHSNRGRLTVDIGGKWKLYTNFIPASSIPIGVVHRGDFGSGALVKLSSGFYVQINAGVISMICQRKIAAAIEKTTQKQ